jgi:hypothetical protein
LDIVGVANFKPGRTTKNWNKYFIKEIIQGTHTMKRKDSSILLDGSEIGYYRCKSCRPTERRAHGCKALMHLHLDYSKISNVGDSPIKNIILIGEHTCAPDIKQTINNCVIVDERDAMVEMANSIIETEPQRKAKDTSKFVSRHFEDKHSGKLFSFI